MATTLGGCHFCLGMIGFGTQLFIQFINEARWRLFPRKVTNEEVKFLELYFPYFSRLKPIYRREFLDKLETILSTKRFIPRGSLEKVTTEMEIFIGATITMVVFGWKNLRLSHFHTILVYPDSYYSTVNQVHHRGEVNPKHGLIVLSWNCFVEGMADHSDGRHVGIHEIAHALKLSNWIHSDEEKGFNPKAWEAYKKWVPMEIQKIRTGEDSLFRERAGVNEHEFFAVVLETFFEQSRAFKAYHPQFYQAVVLLLRQDPLVVLN